MQLSAILLARVIFFVESADLNPRGAAFYPDVIRAFVERYRFQTYPQRAEDFDESKGVTLAMGRLGNVTIDKVVIYNWGLSLDTTSSTDDSEELLDSALAWGAESLHLHYSRDMIKRKSYVSQISFFTDVPMLSLHPMLATTGDAISSAVKQHLKLPYKFHPRGIVFGIDPEEQRIPIPPFTLERRDGIAFSENKYFSSAPVPTRIHLQVVEAFEDAMRRRP